MALRPLNQTTNTNLLQQLANTRLSGITKPTNTTTTPSSSSVSNIFSTSPANTNPYNTSLVNKPTTNTYPTGSFNTSTGNTQTSGTIMGTQSPTSISDFLNTIKPQNTTTNNTSGGRYSGKHTNSTTPTTNTTISSGNYNITKPSFEDMLAQAKTTLGELDTSDYDQILALYESQYSGAVGDLEASFSTLMKKLARQKEENKQAFSKGRATAGENAYDTARQQQIALASRGLAGSGLQQLGDVQNRMELGQQLSSLADAYYDASQNINDTEKEAVQNKASQLRQLGESLSSAQANVNSQRKNYIQNYNSSVANLAQQMMNQQIGIDQFNANMNFQSDVNAQNMAINQANLALQKESLDYNKSLGYRDMASQYIALLSDDNLSLADKKAYANIMDSNLAKSGLTNNEQLKLKSTVNDGIASQNKANISTIVDGSKDKKNLVSNLVSGIKSGEITVDNSMKNDLWESYSSAKNNGWFSGSALSKNQFIELLDDASSGSSTKTESNYSNTLFNSMYANR